MSALLLTTSNFGHKSMYFERTRATLSLKARFEPSCIDIIAFKILVEEIPEAFNHAKCGFGSAAESKLLSLMFVVRLRVFNMVSSVGIGKALYKANSV